MHTHCRIFGLSNWLISLYKYCKENSKTTVCALSIHCYYGDYDIIFVHTNPVLQSCFGVRVDLSSTTDGNLTETATTSSQASKKPPSASSVVGSLPTPAATALTSGGESDTEGQVATGSPKPVTGSGGGSGGDDVMETVSLPAVTVGGTQTGATSSSSGSGDEGGIGGGKREPKRKLIDALEEFAPKRRSSRVC